MRVCLHTLWPIEQNFVGGTERFILDTAKSLNRFGFEPFVLCSNTTSTSTIEGVPVVGSIPAEYATRLRNTGNDPVDFIRSTFYANPASFASAARLSDYVEKQLRSVSFDVVHLNTFSASLFEACPPNYLLSIHENPGELNRFWHAGSFEALAELIRTGRRSLPRDLYTPTRYYADIYGKLFDREVRANPIGIPWTNIGPIIPSAPRGCPRILLPSRFFPAQKGHDVLLEALALLVPDLPTLEIVMTGATPAYRSQILEVRQHAVRLGLASQVTVKVTSDIHTEFASATLVVSPERYCSYGIAVREAIGMGLTTVLSDIPPHLEIGADLPNVLFFEEGNAADCARRIQEALVRPRRSKLHTIGYRLDNDFDHQTKVYARLYLDLVQKRS